MGDEFIKCQIREKLKMLNFFNRELATAGAWLIVDPERPNSEDRKFRYNPNTFLDSRIKTKLIDIKKSKTDKQNKPFINYLKLKNSKTRITVSEIKFIISKHKNNNIIIKIQYHNPNL